MHGWDSARWLVLLVVAVSGPARSEVAQRPWPVEPQPINRPENDKGINVLLDNSHDLSFAWLFGLREQLRRSLGYRVTSNQATLSTILRDNAVARQRDQSSHSKRERPFCWAPVPCRYHVVLTYQGGARQPYLPEEIAALEKFVRGGGGVVLVGGSNRTRDYPLRDLAARWGALLEGRASAPITGRQVSWAKWKEGRTFHAVRLSHQGGRWEVLGSGADGAVVAGRRPLGKGYVVVVSDTAVLFEARSPCLGTFDGLIGLAAAGCTPETGPRAVPWEFGYGGGGFWPEKDFDLGGVKVLYAANQLPGVVAGARERLPEVRRHLDKLLPSPPWPGEAFYINLAAGSPGSGWAVNVLSPKVAGITCDDRNLKALCSVAAHELAHTMTGPAASDGTCRADWPPFFSEAHAGYFQRLVGDRMKLGNQPPWWSDPDAQPPHTGVDLNKDNGGKAWAAVWWVWRQIDLRYGEGWYPRWVQRVYQRGVGKPSNPVDLEVIIQTTSEAVGQDVRPIFDRIRAPAEAKP